MRGVSFVSPISVPSPRFTAARAVKPAESQREEVLMDEGELLTTAYPGQSLTLTSRGFAGCQGLVLMAYHPQTGQKGMILTHYGPMDFAVRDNMHCLETLLRRLAKHQNMAESDIRLCLYVPDDVTFRHIRQLPALPIPGPFDPELVRQLQAKAEACLGRPIPTHVIPYDAFAQKAGSLVVSTQENPQAPFQLWIRDENMTGRLYS